MFLRALGFADQRFLHLVGKGDQILLRILFQDPAVLEELGNPVRIQFDVAGLLQILRYSHLDVLAQFGHLRLRMWDNKKTRRLL